MWPVLPSVTSWHFLSLKLIIDADNVSNRPVHRNWYSCYINLGCHKNVWLFIVIWGFISYYKNLFPCSFILFIIGQICREVNNLSVNVKLFELNIVYTSEELFLLKFNMTHLIAALQVSVCKDDLFIRDGYST